MRFLVALKIPDTVVLELFTVQATGPLNAGDPLNAGLMFFLIFPTRVKSFPVILTINTWVNIILILE